MQALRKEPPPAETLIQNTDNPKTIKEYEYERENKSEMPAVAVAAIPAPVLHRRV